MIVTKLVKLMNDRFSNKDVRQNRIKIKITIISTFIIYPHYFLEFYVIVIISCISV